MSRILTLDKTDDVKVVGQLGSMLGKTIRAGMTVANGFVVPLGIYLGSDESAEILNKYDELGFDSLYLRSSPVAENGEILAVGPVRRAELIGTIKRMQLRARQNWMPSAIVAQVYLDGESCGKIHSENPYTGAHDEIIIEAELWTTGRIQKHEDTAQMIMLNKKDGSIALESGDAKPYLELKQIQQLYHLVRRAEDYFGAAVSLDWGFENGVLYILRTQKIASEEHHD